MTDTALILTALDARIAAARLHTPGGVLRPYDMEGLYRRTAHFFGLTAEEVKALHEARTEGGTGNG
jgi:hypothetical protein